MTWRGGRAGEGSCSRRRHAWFGQRTGASVRDDFEGIERAGASDVVAVSKPPVAGSTALPFPSRFVLVYSDFVAKSDKLRGQYAELIHASTPEEVYENVRKWTSNLSAKQHLIRSIVLTIHANVEDRLKDVLCSHLSSLICRRRGNQTQYDQCQQKLIKTVRSMNFGRVYELLKPALDAFDSPEFALLSGINKLRNDAAHAADKGLLYRGRDLYADHDAVAELFFTSWALRKELNKFVEKMMDDPREFQRIGRNMYFGKKNPPEK